MKDAYLLILKLQPEEWSYNLTYSRDLLKHSLKTAEADRCQLLVCLAPDGQYVPKKRLYTYLVPWFLLLLQKPLGHMPLVACGAILKGTVQKEKTKVYPHFSVKEVLLAYF